MIETQTRPYESYKKFVKTAGTMTLISELIKFDRMIQTYTSLIEQLKIVADFDYDTRPTIEAHLRTKNEVQDVHTFIYDELRKRHA